MGNEAPLWGKGKERAEHGLYQVNRYEPFFKEMDGNWEIEKAREPISERDTDYIRIFKVRKGIAGKVMELFCPQKSAIFIIGQRVLLSNQDNSDNEYPYFFIVRCFDRYDHELSPDTRFNFKVVKGDRTVPSWKASYGELSPVRNEAGEFKKPDERYHFPKGVVLGSSARLELEVLNPDIDIDRVEVCMEVDIFEKQSSSEH